jgi:hypothetical protein
MSPVSAIRLEQGLKARSRAATRNVKTRTVQVRKGAKRVTPVSQKADAVAAVTGKKPSARRSSTKAPKSPGSSKPSVWMSAKGVVVKPKDKVKTSDGFVLTILGRWHKVLKDGTKVPYITGSIAKAPAGAVASAKGGSKNRAVPASDVTHV